MQKGRRSDLLHCPRIRGEYSVQYAVSGFKMGSSPHARGIYSKTTGDASCVRLSNYMLRCETVVDARNISSGFGFVEFYNSFISVLSPVST